METADLRQKALAIALVSPSFSRRPYRYCNREHFIVAYRPDGAELVP